MIDRKRFQDSPEPAGVIMRNDKARIAVIGTGWWSTFAHIPTLKAHPDAELVALADIRPEVLSKAARHYEVERTYWDFREMLAKETLDGVVIAVWHTAHYEVARTCLEHDLHLVLEKPMVLKAIHARDLVEESRRRQLQIVMSYPWQFLPQSERAREALQSGQLGPIHYISNTFTSSPINLYRGDDEADQPGMEHNYPVVGPGDVYSDPERSGGGQGHLQVTHSAAMMFFLTDLKPVSVMAQMESLDVRVDVVDAMIVRMDNGALATVGSTGAVSGGQGKLDIQIYCANGWIDLDYIAGTGTIVYGNGKEENLTPSPDKIETDHPGSNSVGAGTAYPAHLPTTNLVQIILDKAGNRSPVEYGWRTVEFLDAAYRSAKIEGKEVTVASLYG